MSLTGDSLLQPMRGHPKHPPSVTAPEPLIHTSLQQGKSLFMALGQAGHTDPSRNITEQEVNRNTQEEEIPVNTPDCCYN